MTVAETVARGEQESMAKKVLVCGAAGWLGRAITDELIEAVRAPAFWAAPLRCLRCLTACLPLTPPTLLTSAGAFPRAR